MHIDDAIPILEALVGTPHRDQQPDDDASRLELVTALDTQTLNDGIDCIELIIAAYAAFARCDPAGGWTFPIPAYPWPSPGSWDGDNGLVRWWTRWQPIQVPQMGAVASFAGHHAGIVILGRNETPSAARILHTDRRRGTVIQRLAAVADQVTAVYRLLGEHRHG